MANNYNWYFTKEQLVNTPSRKFQIDAVKELSYRQQAANFIADMGKRLKLTHLCINTAVMYMHRFYMFHTFSEVHRNKLAVSALFLAAKAEEQPRKLEHVIKVAHACLHRDNPHLDVNQDAYIEKVADTVKYEDMLLQTLGFDFAIDHPHPHVVKACQRLKVEKEIAEASYVMATNSLHMTTMCLQYKSAVVACVCINVACKQAKYTITIHFDGHEWFHVVDSSVTRELLEKLTQEFKAILVANNHWFRRNGENNSAGPSSRNSLPIKNVGDRPGPSNPLPVQNAVSDPSPENLLPVQNAMSDSSPENLLPVQNHMSDSSPENLMPVQNAMSGPSLEILLPAKKAGSNTSSKNLLPLEIAGNDPSPKKQLPVKNAGSNSCSKNLIPVKRTGSNPGPKNLLPVENAGRADRKSSTSTQQTALLPTPCSSSQEQISSLPVFQPPTCASTSPQPSVSAQISKTDVSTSVRQPLMKKRSSIPNDIKLNGLKDIGSLERRLSKEFASNTKEKRKRTKHTSPHSKEKVFITQTDSKSSTSTQPTALPPTPCSSSQAQISSFPLFQPPTSASPTPQPSVPTQISETNGSTSSVRQPRILMKIRGSVPNDIKLNGLKGSGPLERRLSKKIPSSAKETSECTKPTSPHSNERVLITETEKTKGIKIKIRKDSIHLNGVKSTSKINEPFIEKTGSSKAPVSSTKTEHSNPKQERHKKRKHSFSSSAEKVLSNDSEQTTEIKVKIRRDLICLKGVEFSQKSAFFIRQQSTL